MKDSMKEKILAVTVGVSMVIVMVVILLFIGLACEEWGHLVWNSSI